MRRAASVVVAAAALVAASGLVFAGDEPVADGPPGGASVDPLSIGNAIVADPEGVVGVPEAVAAVETRRAALIDCHTQRPAPPSGVAVAYLVFDKKGKATEVRAGGSGDSKLDACVTKVLGGATLARAAGSKGKVWVSVELGFDLLRGPGVGPATTGPVVPDPGETGPSRPTPVELPAESIIALRVLTVSENLDLDDVRTYATKAVTPRLRACHQIALRNDPAAAGQLGLKLEVDARGKVTKVDVDKTTVPGVLRNCTVGHMRRLTFPEPADGAAGKIRLDAVFRIRK